MSNIEVNNLLCPQCFGHHKETTHDSIEVKDCPQCGSYDITGTLSSSLNGEKYKDKRPILSVMVRIGWEYSDKSKPFDIHEKIADELIGQFEKISVEDRINSLINYIGEKTTPSESIDMEKKGFASYSYDIESNLYFVKYLEDIGIAELSRWEIRLTPEGWEKYSKLNERLNSKYCFIAMSFKSNEAKRIFNDVIRDLLEKDLGFIPMVVDREEYNYDVVDKILFEIQRCRFLIANTIDFRPSVYWEAGYAMSLKKEVIWICRKEDIEELEKMAFNTRNLNHIVWGNDKELKEQLKNRIMATVMIK